MNGYNSSELWNTAFTVQAAVSTGQSDAIRQTMVGAAQFIEAHQPLENTADFSSYHRHPLQGGLPLFARPDCSAVCDCPQAGPEGSWAGSGRGCFTYGPCVGVSGLSGTGIPASHAAVQAAVRFLRGKQRSDGGWSETIESCRQRRYVEGGESHAVMTSWALLSLVAAGQGTSDAGRRGLAWVVARRGKRGPWRPEADAG